MKTSNYLAKLPQEATIKSIQVFKDYDLISLDVPTASQRLCPHCGSDDCVIKDSGTIQTVRHIPCNHRGTVVSFHKRRLLCKDCHSSFYETPYWIHPFLRMTQALYDCEWHNKNTHFYRRKYPTLLCLKAFYRYTESVIKILRLRRDNDYAGGRYENNDSNVIQERV
ncbi:transposase family protein [Claveliimonas bilis]|uniref:transposase family protein n=1 Tax=Claveliimonas bilis TaxID=3028070 RepID=UPI00292CB01F|nr:transposase family protein [Claveliimonas bilis]